MAKKKVLNQAKATLIAMNWIGYSKGRCSLCEVAFSTQSFSGSEEAHRMLLKSFFASHTEKKHSHPAA